MNYRVVIGGHSQLPVIPDLSHTEIITCKLSGGKLRDFWSHPNFKCMRDDNHDLAILFLGGNDVNDSCKPSSIISDIINITEYLQQRNRNVVVTLLEPRQYSPNNRFGVSSNTYDKVSGSVNKGLCKILRKKSVRSINLGAKPFNQGHTRDGVHFNSTAKSYIAAKIRNCIEHHRQQINKNYVNRTT